MENLQIPSICIKRSLASQPLQTRLFFRQIDFFLSKSIEFHSIRLLINESFVFFKYVFVFQMGNRLKNQNYQETRDI